MIADPLQNLDLFALAQASALEARRIADLLRGPIADEARALLDEGYAVPAPEALMHAALVFDSVADKPGHGSALGSETAEQRLDLICALGGALSGIDREIDLDWSGVWASYRDGDAAATCIAASAVLDRWNAGERTALLARLQLDAQAAYKREVWNR